MYSYGPPHMAEQKQDDQLEHTYGSYVRIWDVALKTCRRWWTIGRRGKNGSGISVLAARHDDDDDLWNILSEFENRLGKYLSTILTAMLIKMYIKNKTSRIQFVYIKYSLYNVQFISLTLAWLHCQIKIYMLYKVFFLIYIRWICNIIAEGFRFVYLSFRFS